MALRSEQPPSPCICFSCNNCNYFPRQYHISSTLELSTHTRPPGLLLETILTSRSWNDSVNYHNKDKAT